MNVEIKWFEIAGVAPDGRVEAGGAVHVDGRYIRSAVDGGCGNPGCACSPGHWLTKTFPRTENGTVVGYTARFPSREALEQSSYEELDELAAK